MDSPETPSTRTLGPYRLGGLLGRGGMGEVYKAFDDRLGRYVAAKRMRRDASAHGKERFRREARILAQLGHPGIIQIFDWLSDDGDDWILMELIDGPTLAQLRRSGPLLAPLAVSYGRQIASALTAAHDNGIVHRDLKSENVMVLVSGHVKVLDFGLAHRSSWASTTSPDKNGSQSKEEARRIVGTPRAMSPEQALGYELDARSDLFSLGILLYELLTAHSPFAAQNTEETLRRVLEHGPPTVHRLNPKVPRALSKMIDRLLEKDPAGRPASAAEVEDSLIRILPWEMSSSDRSPSSDRSFLETSSLEMREFGSGPSSDETLEPGDTHSSIYSLGSMASLEEETFTDDTALVATLLAGDLITHHEDPNPENPSPEDPSLRDLLRQLATQHGGREIPQSQGFLLLFSRPWNAVGFALDYRQGLAKLSLEARIGIHLGEVVVRRAAGRDIKDGAVEMEGLTQSTAERLMSLAAAGQILLTRTAFEVARRGALDEEHDVRLRWMRHGRHRLQGFAHEEEIFEVGHDDPLPAGDLPAGSEASFEFEQVPENDWHSVGSNPITLRVWPSPQMPEQPYPVLLPYSHPDLLAGRDAELTKLKRMLSTQVPILGLSAPSGTGKSSLLMGGLVPKLRASGVPVTLVRHPSETGLAARLIGDLLEGAPVPTEHDIRIFVEMLVETERLSGTKPVLILDQFEDVLKPEAENARVALGLLMASTLLRRPGGASAPCRWLIAYRQEYYGQLRAWLVDTLREARSREAQARQIADGLPHDLSGPERFQAMTLAPLGSAPAAAPDPLEVSKKVFLQVIQAPLRAAPKNFAWSFADGHDERLADAFALARQDQPDAPLAPELQVVLAHLLAEADLDGCLRVPEETGTLIDQALTEHLRRTLESAFPVDRVDGSLRRARALLALRELADASGRKQEGLSREHLISVIGHQGDEIEEGDRVLELLSAPLARLIRVRQSAQGLRWVISHDRMAEAVVRLVDEDGSRGGLLIDEDLLTLRRFVNLRTELFYAGQRDSSTHISRRRFHRIQSNASTLLTDDNRRFWFEACADRRRLDLRRRTAMGVVLMLLFLFISVGTWLSTENRAESRNWVDQVLKAEPEEAFQALHRLISEGDIENEQILKWLKEREAPMDILEWGLAGLDEPERGSAVLRVAEAALPWIQEAPDDFVLIANLVWALDFSPGRQEHMTESAQALRDQILQPLRDQRPPPSLPQTEDPDWIPVPAGTFLMGTPTDQPGADSERPQHEVTVAPFHMLRHEVTVAQYRRLVPDHQPQADDDLPAAFMTWHSAYVYAAWLGGRLPTEAEWEYAARAGCEHDLCGRDGSKADLDEVAWTLRNVSDTPQGDEAGVLGARPVMGLEPNPWGFYDMLGNLWEWTADAYSDYPAESRADAWGQASNSRRHVYRGGGFWEGAQAARVTSRDDFAAGSGSEALGLRVVLPSLSETSAPEAPAPETVAAETQESPGEISSTGLNPRSR